MIVRIFIFKGQHVSLDYVNLRKNDTISQHLQIIFFLFGNSFLQKQYNPKGYILRDLMQFLQHLQFEDTNLQFPFWYSGPKLATTVRFFTFGSRVFSDYPVSCFSLYKLKYYILSKAFFRVK